MHIWVRLQRIYYFIDEESYLAGMCLFLFPILPALNEDVSLE